MKKILILYFSGAGATLNSIKYMQTCINNITGCSAYIHSMENDLEENINNYDALIIGTPCYHCAPCLTLISFFQKLNLQWFLILIHYGHAIQIELLQK